MESQFVILCTSMENIPDKERSDRIARNMEPESMESARFLMILSMTSIKPSERNMAAMTGIFHNMNSVYHSARIKKRDFL